MITATLAAARFKVISAQVYSWVDTLGRTRALDLFWVRAGEHDGGRDSALPRLERDFNRLMSQELSPSELRDQRQRALATGRTARRRKYRARSTSTIAAPPITR